MGGMGKNRSGRGMLLVNNLPQIQNLIKVSRSFCYSATSRCEARHTDRMVQRDPTGYKPEFLTQYNHYLSLVRLHTSSASAASLLSSSSVQGNNGEKDKSAEQFSELITFVCQVAQCYPEETKDLISQLKGLLLGQGGVGMVQGELRKTVVKNLVILRNKDVIDSVE
jgi:protein SDA1